MLLKLALNIICNRIRTGVFFLSVHGHDVLLSTTLHNIFDLSSLSFQIKLVHFFFALDVGGRVRSVLGIVKN